jgi:hypothetical protein
MNAEEQLYEYLSRLSRVADELESIARGLVELAEQSEIRFADGYDTGFDEDDEPVDEDARPDEPTL